MLSKQVLAVSGDKAIARLLDQGLKAAGGAVHSATSVAGLPADAMDADLVVLHLADAQLGPLETLARRGKGGHIVVVVTESSLPHLVAVLKVERVIAVLVADELTPRAIATVASRALYGDIFGLEHVMPWGVRVYSLLVGDYQEKSLAISAISDFAAAMGIRRKYRDSIEQCLDEMLMNALYDAPIDKSGRHHLAEMPTKTRISLRVEQKAVVQYACDGTRFALSVRDSFGTLRAQTVAEYLERCTQAAAPLERTRGGAGLGLFIICSATTSFTLNIYPNVATEAICVFDLTAPKVQLRELGVYHERIDSTGLIAAGRSHLTQTTGGAGARPRTPRLMSALLAMALLLLLSLIGIVLYPRWRTDKAGAISIRTDPPGARIELDGRIVGSTSDEPIVLRDLAVGQSYRVTAFHEGFEPRQELVSPRQGAAQSMLLQLASQAATVILDSEPPGATIYIDTKAVGTTPSTARDLAPGSHQAITFKKAGYSAIERTIEVPRAGREMHIVVPLAMDSHLASVRMVTHPPGAEVVQNGELLVGVLTPVEEHLVEANKLYEFTFRRKGFMPAQASARVGPGQRGVLVSHELTPGGSLTVHVNVPRVRISVAGVKDCQDVPSPMEHCPLANGNYKVLITSRSPFVAEKLDVTIASEEVRRQLDLGYVETRGDGLELKIRGAPKGTRRAAFAPGSRKITVVDAAGQAFETTVRVVADQTVSVDAGEGG